MEVSKLGEIVGGIILLLLIVSLITCKAVTQNKYNNLLNKECTLLEEKVFVHKVSNDRDIVNVMNRGFESYKVDGSLLKDCKVKTLNIID